MTYITQKLLILWSICFSLWQAFPRQLIWIRYLLDLVSSCCCSLTRLGYGMFVTHSVERLPIKPIRLYEFEGCPYCRNVREVASMLDLDLDIYPCPRVTFQQSGIHKDSRFRPVVSTIGGRVQFPFMWDENTSVKLYESEKIIKYLLETYGDSDTRMPWIHRPGIQQMLLYGACLFRPFPTMGMLRCPSKKPMQCIELWSYEAHPQARLIRETLCCLELQYTLHNVAFGTSKFHSSLRLVSYLKSLSNVPRLKDHNTGFDSTNPYRIIEYLKQTYQTGDCKVDYACCQGSTGIATKSL